MHVSIPKTVVADQGTIFFEGSDFPPSEAHSGGWGGLGEDGGKWLPNYLAKTLPHHGFKDASTMHRALS